MFGRLRIPKYLETKFGNYGNIKKKLREKKKLEISTKRPSIRTALKTAAFFQGKNVENVPYATVYTTPPWDSFPRSITRQPRKRVPGPNDKYPESSRRDASKADLLGTDSFPTVEISNTENRPRGV